MFGKNIGHGGTDECFFFMGSLKEFFEHGEALVCQGDLAVGMAAVEEDVEVGAIDEGGPGCPMPRG